MFRTPATKYATHAGCPQSIVPYAFDYFMAAEPKVNQDKQVFTCALQTIKFASGQAKKYQAGITKS